MYLYALQISRMAHFHEEGAKQADTNDKVSTTNALKWNAATGQQCNTRHHQFKENWRFARGLKLKTISSNEIVHTFCLLSKSNFTSIVFFTI